MMGWQKPKIIMSFFEKMFASKANSKKEENPTERRETLKRKNGPYRESGEIIDPDELKRTKEKLKKSGKYDRIGNFEEGVAWAHNTKTKKVVLINENGEEISEEFDTIGKFYDGIAQVTRTNKEKFCEYSFINRRGKLLGEKWFNVLNVFREGLAVVKKDEKWFFVDKNLEKIEKLGDWEDAGYGFGRSGFDIERSGFNPKSGFVILKGACWVKKDGKWIAIDKEGKTMMTYKDLQRRPTEI